MVSYCLMSVGAEPYPSISTIRNSWLYSELPGNNGRPRNSSATIQPKDHMSIAPVYRMFSKTSGDL